jgi:hypothetical protein
MSSSSRQILDRECQEKQDISIKITIAPGSIIDIKFSTTEIKIGKRRSSEELVSERKGKRARSIHG